MKPPAALRARQRLGKYRVEKLLGQGGFADVFRAYDTIEGIRVALKVPKAELVSASLLEDFRKEVRLTARLDHANILPIKNADTIEGHFVIVYPLGEGTLADRLTRRLSFPRAFDFAEQVLEALAHAHSHRVMHCDVKPDNFILFGERLRLSDFGISKVALRTMHASGSGTLGFMAPEQAMGRPSLRSDVFAAGLLLYRLFAGVVPEWPFDWPPPGFERARRKLHPDVLGLLQRSLRIDPRARFSDAIHMRDAFQALRTRALRYADRKRAVSAPRARKVDWRAARIRHFERTYRKELGAHLACRRCDRPVSETMLACPWCSTSRKKLKDETSFPAACPRCSRGLKLDWKFCPWCYGGLVGPSSTRHYTDKRYSARCGSCRGDLMPFMRYCPWCRAKVRKSWTLSKGGSSCGSCGWGVLPDYWSTCPWCTADIVRAPSRRGAGRKAR